LIEVLHVLVEHHEGPVQVGEDGVEVSPVIAE
jgi:hypothetical protein